MNEKLKTILEKALNMPQEQRAFIASRLIDSLDDKADADVEAAGQDEIQKRIASAEKGEASFMPWESLISSPHILKYMNKFKRLMDTCTRTELDYSTANYKGFYDFALLMEDFAIAIQDGEIKVP